MDDQHRTRRWERIQTDPAIDPLHALRASIVDIRNAPRDLEARRRLRAIAAEQGLWEELALLLADEARASAHRPTVMAAFYEELADVYENLDQLVEAIAAIEQVAELLPEEAGHHDRLAKLYLRAGAWAKAASAFERFAQVEPDERGATALRAAARLYRDNRRADHAAAVYRKLVERRPDDADAWRALDELLHELGQWEELAEVRGERAARARTGLEKAALLRARPARSSRSASSRRRRSWSRAPRATRPTASAAWSITPTCSRAAAAAARPPSCSRCGSPRRPSAAPGATTSPRCACGWPGSSRTRAATAPARARCSTSCSPPRRATCRRSSAPPRAPRPATRPRPRRGAAALRRGVT